ncbi:MAG: WGR domain-containing protein [Myxococcales bacterium]
MKRYFEFVEGTSSKFWEIWREGQNVYTRYGKIGAAGQVTLKDEGSEEKAQKLYDKLVREKTGKGYVEKTPAGGAPAAAAPAPAPAAKAAAAPAPAPAPAAKPAPAPAAAPAVSAGGTRRFEFAEGGSSKFWEITISGDSHTVRFGKIGTPGQEKTKTFGSDAEAQKDAEKLVAEKTKKGYAEVSAGGAEAGPPAPPIDGPELDEHLAAIAKAPADAEKRQVFGDWLQSKGHPWGELIALNHAAATAPNATKRAEFEKAVTQLLQKQGAAILGDLARAGRPTRFEWSYGFLKEVVLASPTDKLVLKERVQTMLGLPAARQLEKLTLHAQPLKFTPHSDWDTSTEDIVQPWKDVIPLLAKLPPSVKALAFGEPPPDSASGYVAKPDFAALAKAMPKLESLEVQCAGSDDGLGKIDFPELKNLELRLANADPQDLESIQKARLPKLERLTVWLGGFSNCTLDDAISPSEWDEDNEDGSRYPDHYAASVLEELEVYDIESNLNAPAVTAFANSTFPSTLKHLGIHSAQLDASLLDAICKAPVVKQLESLSLEGGTLGDAAADVLIKNKDRLAHLKTILAGPQHPAEAGHHEDRRRARECEVRKAARQRAGRTGVHLPVRRDHGVSAVDRPRSPRPSLLTERGPLA